MSNEPMTLDMCLEKLRTDKSYNQYLAVSQAIKNEGPVHVRPTLKAFILRNYTVEPLIPILEGEVALAGFHPIIEVGGFDSIAYDIFGVGSKVESFGPDVIILSQWLAALAPVLTDRFPSLTADEVNQCIDDVIERTAVFIDNLRQRYNTPIIINNFPLPPFAALGILDCQSPLGQYQAIILLNQKLQQLTDKWQDVYIADYFGVFSRVGMARGFDSRYWHMAKAPISRDALTAIGQEYGKYVRAFKGKVKKCLILDCDNTLWGGVIGEEGLNGIKLGREYPGSFYQTFQREILNLHDRGVLLALCSKNNEQDIIEVLRQHPEMILKEENFATWQINWDDKVTNIRRIAESLNIGLDSMVFIDDNLFEVNWVKDQIPEIEALHLPKEAFNYQQLLCACGLFDSLAFSPEDRRRTAMYKNDAKRQQLKGTSGSLEDYLNRLNMVAEIGIPDAAQISRIAQLTQKTNQFNLTTRRYTDGEIEAMINADDAAVFCIKLKDCIDDLGLIGAVILRIDEKTAIIENLLLSCRALGRGVEDALLAHALHFLNSLGCREVRGIYRPSSKNMQVADFYFKRGFRLITENEQEKIWSASLTDLKFSSPKWIQVDIK